MRRLRPCVLVAAAACLVTPALTTSLRASAPAKTMPPRAQAAPLHAGNYVGPRPCTGEACHGPATGWLGYHVTKDAKHEESVKRGMYDTKDVVKRTEKCLTCHLGTSEKFVDHEMIAAGHPDLVFELEAFSAAMPRHWKE